MGIREQQKEKRRKEILLAGLDLFIRRGYSATKIKDIADQVGMSVGLLFHYFDTKEKLYEELIRQGVANPINMIGNNDLDPLLFFQNIVDQIFHMIQAEPNTAKMFVLMNQAYNNEAAPPTVKELLNSYDVFTPAFELMKKGQEIGTIREGDPYALVIAIWCSIQGIVDQISIDPLAPIPKSEWIVDIIRKK